LEFQFCFFQKYKTGPLYSVTLGHLPFCNPCERSSSCVMHSLHSQMSCFANFGYLNLLIKVLLLQSVNSICI
jgi:hypothetical protein